jgi:serine/threonine-protein kinase
VPPELERILQRALARDRDERYSTARELGQELSRFLFRFAQPVSGYDIAAIVQATMRERENARLAQGSFIHRLIEEALLQFTSLQGDGAASADLPGAAGAPLNAELFVDPLRPVRPAGPPAAPSRPADGPEQGNLAALEDDADADAATRSGDGGARRPESRASADDAPVRRAPSDPTSGSDLARRTRRHRMALGIAVVLVLAAASLAWLTGILPHR